MWERLDNEDTKKLIEYLKVHSPNTCNILSNVKHIGVSYNPFQFRTGYYYVYKDSENIKGLVVIYNDGNAFVHISDNKAKQGAQNILIQTRYHSVWGLSEWLPDIKILEYHIKNKFDSRELVTMVRDKDTPLPETSRKLIRIDNKFYLNKYIPFIRKCLYEGFGFKPLAIDIKKRMRERTPKEPYYLLYDYDAPVSQVHIQSVTDEYGYIAGVCTPRIYRRNGYAREITSYACKYVESLGLKSALTVSVTNTAAIKMYKEIGFVDADTIVVYMKHREFAGDENA